MPAICARRAAPVWILGHLLLGDVYLSTLLGADSLSDDFQTLMRRYGPGVTPAPALDHYDAKPALVDRLAATGVRRLDVIRRLTLVDLSRTTPDAPLPGRSRRSVTTCRHWSATRAITAVSSRRGGGHTG